jgi:monoamine oxidase
MANGDLIWNRHEGRGDGTFAWAADVGRKVGNGWNPKHVFAGEHTSQDFQGYLNGAVETGARAAGEILADLKHA